MRKTNQRRLRWAAFAAAPAFCAYAPLARGGEPVFLGEPGASPAAVVPVSQPAATQPAETPDPAPESGGPVRLPETVIGGGAAPTTDEAPAPPQPPTGDERAFATPGEVFDRAFNAPVEGNFLPDVEGVKIFGGKKTYNIDMVDRPPVINNSFRQAFQQTPSLVLAEESTPLVSFGYRGLPPDRGQYTQVLKDGIPMSADMIGYPESYYFPPFQNIDRMEFVHGGAALMYGPQPGGALNLITKSPTPGVDFAAYTENIFGSNNFFSTYNSISSFPGDLGYYAYAHHRDTDGFRVSNSQVQLNSGGAKFVTRLSPTEQVISSFDLFEESHGDPGGLTRDTFYRLRDRTLTTRVNDRFELSRYAAWAAYQAEVDEETFFELKFWGTYMGRGSRRQNLAVGQTDAFGTVPTGATSTLQLQQFYSAGFEPRFRRDWGDEGQHTWTGGTMYYHTLSPRTDSLGNPTISNFIGPVVTGASDRSTDYFSVFTENRFVFDRFTVTPGMRFENIWQSVIEGVNANRPAVQNEQVFNFAPLFGIGSTYQLSDAWQWYGNVSQAYRPPTFTQAVVVGAGQTVSGNLQEAKSYQAESGFKANLWPYLTVDASLFYMDFSNQIGTVGTNIQNVGAAYYRGGEFQVYSDLARWSDELNDTNLADQYGSFIFFYNSMWLDAEFYKGTPGANGTQGKRPQYAPEYLMRSGAEWKYGATSVRLAGTWQASTFANDNNTANFFIPAFDVWDFTTKFQLTRNGAVVGGINNVFNEFYASRINASGIDPVNGRNYYLGFQAGY